MIKARGTNSYDCTRCKREIILHREKMRITLTAEIQEEYQLTEKLLGHFCKDCYRIILEAIKNEPSKPEVTQ